ncbi:hypothetical protein KAX97_12595 [candidate division WOR-3 bacterium]|nr:hypothetical protein [candidate division WOR-3 bacterium]
MNPDNFESKVASLELAKRLRKARWDKETVFGWAEIYTHGNWVLAVHIGEKFYTVDSSGEIFEGEIVDGQMIDWMDAPLSCEILEEFKNARFEPLMNTNVIVEIVQVKTHVVCLLKDVWDNVLHKEKSDVLVEALANLWNWYQENNKEE